MNEITRSSRVTTALQVIARMNEGLTVRDACLEVGIPRSTFYNIIARDTEAIAVFQDMVIANHRERLWMVLVNQATGEVMYTPPQDHDQIVELLERLLVFFNQAADVGLDPLVRMVLMHYQFEKIYPFYDGNGEPAAF